MTADVAADTPTDLPALAAKLERLLRLRLIPFGIQLFERCVDVEAISRIRRPEPVHTLK